MQEAVADDAAFTVVLTIIYDLDRGAREDQKSVLEIQAALGESVVAPDKPLSKPPNTAGVKN